MFFSVAKVDVSVGARRALAAADRGAIPLAHHLGRHSGRF
jgi:hypothetical protein